MSQTIRSDINCLLKIGGILAGQKCLPHLFSESGVPGGTDISVCAFFNRLLKMTRTPFA